MICGRGRALDGSWAIQDCISCERARHAFPSFRLFGWLRIPSRPNEPLTLPRCLGSRSRFQPFLRVFQVSRDSLMCLPQSFVICIGDWAL